ncbi:superoxide dismutase family protein [Gephyromycinifex aptenodytis]|uniref:superoxide dismutase family protein n=1 Tax=Gephyromycinifex aptenodytis TaxID=2716227 RepID=UPI00144892C2|nr:superoxide dismutase family protein [Gephyromycinifex aptenodytis]
MRRHLVTAVTIAGLLTAAGCSSQDAAVPSDQAAATAAATATATDEEAPDATATLKDAAGKEVGTVEFSDVDGSSTEISVTVEGLTPGFHGLHLHTTGKCEPNSADPKDAAKTGDFLSAGGHLAGEGADHPEHAGDLPTLYVGKNGIGELTALTDRVTMQDLQDGDGTSVMIHSGSDNYANIPTRYAATGADEMTKKAGDGGERIACGVVEK